MSKENTMETTKNWIEEVATRLNIKNQHGKGQQLATALGIGVGTALDQMKGRCEMGLEQAKKTSRILGINPMIVIASTSYHRSKNSGKEEEALDWKSTYEKIKKEEEIEQQTETME
jgi:hypothetical protein